MSNDAKQESRDQRFDRQTKEQFEYLGRFVQAFELMVNESRKACLFFTSKGGVPQQLMMIVFNHRSLTAVPLLEIFRTMVAQMLHHPDGTLEKEEVEAIKSILSQIGRDYQYLAEARNEIVHGTWFVGWASPSDVDFSVMTGMKGKLAPNEGLTWANMPSSIEDLQTLIKRCEDQTNLLARLVGCFMTDRSVAKSFVNAKATMPDGKTKLIWQ
jgi:hypothetical protein